MFDTYILWLSLFNAGFTLLVLAYLIFATRRTA